MVLLSKIPLLRSKILSAKKQGETENTGVMPLTTPIMGIIPLLSLIT